MASTQFHIKPRRLQWDSHTCSLQYNHSSFPLHFASMSSIPLDAESRPFPVECENPLSLLAYVVSNIYEFEAASVLVNMRAKSDNTIAPSPPIVTTSATNSQAGIANRSVAPLPARNSRAAPVAPPLIIRIPARLKSAPSRNSLTSTISTAGRNVISLPTRSQKPLAVRYDDNHGTRICLKIPTMSNPELTSTSSTLLRVKASPSSDPASNNPLENGKAVRIPNTTSAVRCNGCKKRISLDARGDFYFSNFSKHARICKYLS
jgi:hypothetical protein